MDLGVITGEQRRYESKEVSVEQPGASVGQPRALPIDVDAWAREHWLTVHPWAERVRVVRVVSAPPTEDW